MPGHRGFTLFTALVAFILIVLAMLLVQAMIRAERNTTEIVADIEEQAEMQAIADLARADALQLFNYGIRLSIEDFLTVDNNPADGVPDNAYLLNPDLLDWEEIQADFAKENFGGKEYIDPETKEVKVISMNFANTTAYHLTTLLEKIPDARGFEFGLDNKDEEMLRQSLQEVFATSTKEGEFFEVINCPDGEFENCLGTFYITLDLSKENMDDKVYESLPMIRVENTTTKRVLKQPILPRGKFRIYVPLRVFKAIAGAREIAEGRGGVLGLFNSGFHDAIDDDMKLGVCDQGYCTERTEPTAPPDEQSGSEPCPGRQDVEGMKTQLRAYIKDAINRRISELVAAAPDMKKLAEDAGFPLVGTLEKGNPAGKTTVVAGADESRELVDESGTNIGNLWCSEAVYTEAKVVFEEKNPKYMVRGKGAEGTVQRYAVVLHDTYDATYDAGQNMETCISGKDSCKPG